VNALEPYLSELSANRAAGSVPETSGYGALATLLNEVGHKLKPRVRCVVNPANTGAGIPDGGLFIANQFEKGSTEPLPGQASRLVGWALYGLIAYILASSILSLALGGRAESSSVGVALAVAALIVMPLLWRWRLGLAARLDSPALCADAACSLVCIYMSATLLGGLLLNRLLGWWWADSLAALVMIWWIHGEAAEALEAARVGRHDDD
jgi:hypothetical protein